MPTYASRAVLIEESKEKDVEIATLKEEVASACGSVPAAGVSEESRKIINNPHKEIPTLRFKCVCCIEIEIRTLTYNLPLCAMCHRPMTRLKTWTS